MGCFVRGGKSLWDVLSGVSKNGMGCFVLGCFVRLPPLVVQLTMAEIPVNMYRVFSFLDKTLQKVCVLLGKLF